MVTPEHFTCGDLSDLHDPSCHGCCYDHFHVREEEAEAETRSQFVSAVSRAPRSCQSPAHGHANKWPSRASKLHLLDSADFLEGKMNDVYPLQVSILGTLPIW